jgi:hypothetical protein
MRVFFDITKRRTHKCESASAEGQGSLDDPHITACGSLTYRKATGVSNALAVFRTINNMVK